MTDQEAVRAALRDPDAFSVLVVRYQEPLGRYVRRLGISDPETRKDILQEAFIKAYVNLNDYISSLPFSSWIYRIAHNETMTYFRRMKNRPRTLPSGDWSIFEQVSDELDIERETEEKLRGARIARAVAALKPAYRDVIVLRFFEGKTYEEISDILELPEGTVATYISRGKRSLVALLEDEHITDV